jgi:hypothetical protein
VIFKLALARIVNAVNQALGNALLRLNTRLVEVDFC